MVLLDTGTPGASREIYSKNADGETRTCNDVIYVWKFWAHKESWLKILKIESGPPLASSSIICRVFLS